MTPEELHDLAVKERESQRLIEHKIGVCVAAGCLSSEADKVQAALAQAALKNPYDKTCRVKGVGCMGLCKAGPLVFHATKGNLYKEVKPDDAGEILKTLDKGAPPRLKCETEIPFFKRQQKIVLENCGAVDPERIEDYIAAEGYVALAKVLTQFHPAGVVEEIHQSGLRGRGGAGFPTSLKWSTVAKAPGPKKYVICNADEGDPGAFMDRSVLESDPHRVLEGMAVAGYAVGAQEGFVYVRAEYPLAIKRLRTAIRQAERLNLLGPGILNTPFNFKIELRIGAGAFVCGEETALIGSIEGGRGTPRPRPPFPAEYGLWKCPTLINNVETFANIAPIIRKGGRWFASIGTEKSKGTKVFALAGKINNTGLIEVPMGITLREIIFDIGGGIPDGKRFKAVQTGGPSGGCLPESCLDMAIDYESLAKAGSIMGSGGMIIMDETSCMVDVARFFMEFCMSESCGKCVPCRVGTATMFDLLTKITRGEASMETLAMLEQLCDLVRNTSLCGLGQTAPNPVLSTLRYFRDEYLTHIEEKRCPSGVCQAAVPAGAH